VAYGYSAHTANTVFWIAARSLKQAKRNRRPSIAGRCMRRDCRAVDRLRLALCAVC
jgi:hypothetical protein